MGVGVEKERKSLGGWEFVKGGMGGGRRVDAGGDDESDHVRAKCVWRWACKALTQNTYHLLRTLQ